jgi:hypothetical protein
MAVALECGYESGRERKARPYTEVSYEADHHLFWQNEPKILAIFQSLDDSEIRNIRRAASISARPIKLNLHDGDCRIDATWCALFAGSLAWSNVVPRPKKSVVKKIPPRSPYSKLSACSDRRLCCRRDASNTSSRSLLNWSPRSRQSVQLSKCTADGDRHGLADRILAPQRRLKSIGPVWRG